MSEQIKRVNRELKFKGTIIDFYQDTMEINGDHTVCLLYTSPSPRD